jgi:hypothetical protein
MLIWEILIKFLYIIMMRLIENSKLNNILKNMFIILTNPKLNNMTDSNSKKNL